MKFMLMMHAPKGDGDWNVSDWRREDLEAHIDFMRRFNGELAAASEPIGQTWAVDLQQVLYDALELKRRYHGNGQLIPAAQIATLIARYAAGLRAGYAANPPSPPTGPPKRGRRPRGKTLSLLDRLRDRQVETLRCLHDPHVPWCNNQAEQDIRMMKVQQKISGGFRTEQGAIDFCRIRSYLSTLQKNQINLFDGIVHALADKPWLPSQLPSAAHEKMSCSHDQEKIAA